LLRSHEGGRRSRGQRELDGDAHDEERAHGPSPTMDSRITTGFASGRGCGGGCQPRLSTGACSVCRATFIASATAYNAPNAPSEVAGIHARR
jgi:hypothetical protein